MNSFLFPIISYCLKIYNYYFNYYEIVNKKIENTYNILSVILNDADITNDFITNIYDLKKNKKISYYLKNLPINFNLEILLLNEFGNIQTIKYNKNSDLVLFHHGINWFKFDKKERKKLFKKLEFLDLSSKSINTKI